MQMATPHYLMVTHVMITIILVKMSLKRDM